jgi:hypothetical protein
MSYIGLHGLPRSFLPSFPNRQISLLLDKSLNTLLASFHSTSHVLACLKLAALAQIVQVSQRTRLQKWAILRNKNPFQNGLYSLTTVGLFDLQNSIFPLGQTVQN